MPKRVSMREVARAAKVATATVSLVVRGQPGVSQETRKHVLDTLNRLGYPMPGNSPGAKKPVIGLLIEKTSVPVILDAFYGPVISGLQTEAQRLGYQVFLHMFDRTLDDLDNLRAELPENTQGLVIANDGDFSSEMVIRLEALRLPLVLIENYLPGHELPCILGDNFMAGYTAMQYLLELGHRSIAILPGPSKYSSLLDRLRGCLSGAVEAGLHIPADWMPKPVQGHTKKGYIQMREILQLPDRPSAIISISDKTAFGAMEAIKEAGLRIPEDISIVSIDDVNEAAQANPPLTTVLIPKYEMGVLAMQNLHQVIKDPTTLPVKSIVYSKLIERESCRAF